MQKRQMGRDGIPVACLGVGAMSFAEFYGPTTEENSYDRILVLAGIRKITAEMNSRMWNQARPKPPTPRF